MTDATGSTRRRVLQTGALALAALAGCSGGSGENGGGTETPTDGDGDTGATPDNTDAPVGTPTDDTDDEAGTTTGQGVGTTTGGSGTSTPELDLREANVVGVEFDGSSGSVRFSVTLYHDDDGEDGYANWWQVERLDGTRLGRRKLLHAHSTAPFTRSETIDVPDGVTCVVVRGHDQTHEYGGRAMLVNLERGATRAVGQGPERRSFSADDCP